MKQFSFSFPGAEIQMTAAVSGVVPDDTFTVSQAVNALGFGKFQILLSFVTGKYLYIPAYISSGLLLLAVRVAMLS